MPPITANQIISAFKQGDAGNCASISVIKLALFQYGFEATLQPVAQADGYSVTLMDGTNMQLTTAEIQSVAAVSDFANIQDATIADQAQLTYAVMVKNKFQQDGGATLTDVIDSTDHFLDMDTTKNFGYLGLGAKYDSLNNFDTNYLGNLAAYILTNFKHSAFAFGPNYDEHGTSTPITSFVNNHSTLLTRLFASRQIDGAYTPKI